MDLILQTIYNGILNGDMTDVKEAVEEALHSGLNAEMLLYEGMISAMREVGTRFEKGDYFVPEMLISARAMQAGLAILKPHLQRNNIRSAGRVVIGTVKGDLHDIGKNLVSMMLEGAGFEVMDLGTDVPPEKFIAAIRQGRVDVLAMSALLTTTMPSMKTTIEALQAADLRDKVKIIVGGAPVTAIYAKQIGADGYAPDASRAVSLVQSLLEGRRSLLV